MAREGGTRVDLQVSAMRSFRIAGSSGSGLSFSSSSPPTKPPFPPKLFDKVSAWAVSEVLQVSEAGGGMFSSSEVKTLILSREEFFGKDILESGVEVVEAGAVSGDFVKASGST